jgi:UDP-N-acetylmuramoyl-tripeptide--D-alanyl-D-alanine ligase
MANSALNIFYILWAIQIVKAMFFWLYLWQLKEYHLKRFVDHFRTEKGKQILRSPVRLVKVLFLALALFLPMFWPLLIVYAAQTAAFLTKTSPKKPVFTAKMVFLALVNTAGFGAIALYSSRLTLNRTVMALLLADIFLPLIVSGIVLLLQPLAVLFRQQIINRAKAKRNGFKNLTVIGITGSYGKTSTKEFLKTVLGQKFRVLATEEHQNSEIAISRCILNDLKPEHQVFICEMGAYDKGKVKEVSEITKPKIGIVAGINEQHLALFGSMENLMSAEGGIELVKSLPENGVLVLNEDNTLIQKDEVNIKYQNDNSKIKIEFCSAKQKTDLWAENIIVEKEWLYFKAYDRMGESADFKINLVGRQNIENILLAAACAKELGMTLREIAGVCEQIKSGQGAMKLVLGLAKHKADIIDSSYSANPDGVLAALEHLKLWSGEKVIVMPCLIELGPAAKKAHEKIGKKIGEICDFAVITTKDWFEVIKKAAVAAGMKPGNIIFSENPREIFEKIKSFSSSEDVILLEGRVPQDLFNHLKNKTVPAI